MMRRIVLIAVMLFLTSSVTLAAESRVAASTGKSSKVGDSSGSALAAAVGGVLAWNVREDYGQRSYRRFSPELVGFGYFSLSHNVWLRPGARVGYAWMQPQMPKAVRVEETDLLLAAELGAVYDWILVPSLSFGGGVDYRTIKFRSEAPVDSADDKISGKETLTFWHTQLGVGFPLLKGLIVAEPFARYWNLKSDDRSHWTFGIETTVQVY